MTDYKIRKSDLEEDLKKIDSEIRTLKGDRTLRLGLFGRRRSAKSSWLAMLYLFRISAAHGVDIQFSNDETRLYLQGLTEAIFETGSAAATRQGEPAIIKFKLNLAKDNQKETWDVETWDFTGGFVDSSPSNSALENLTQRCRDFLLKSDVIICFYYWKDFGVAQLDSLETVFESGNYRIILALTRLDELGPLPKADGDWEGFLEAVNLTPAQKRTLEEFRIRLEGLRSGALYGTLVCPLGKDYSDPQNLPQGRTYPLTRDDLSPVHIYRPLLRAVQLKKQRETTLQERRSNLRVELEQLEAKITRVKSQQRDAKQKQLDFARQNLAELKTQIASATGDPEVPDNNPALEANHATAKRIHEIGKLQGDNELVSQARQLAKQLDTQRQERDRRKCNAELDARFSVLEAEVTEEGLDAGWGKWNRSPVNKWLLELVGLEEKAKALAHDELSKKCRRLISKIRFRGLRHWLVVPTAILGIAAALFMFGRKLLD